LLLPFPPFGRSFLLAFFETNVGLQSGPSSHEPGAGMPTNVFAGMRKDETLSMQCRLTSGLNPS
jgi:hypothetical protein